MRSGSASLRGGGDEADLAAHRLHHQDRVGRRRAGVLLVRAEHAAGPVPRDRAVAGRVVDELELRIADVVVDRLRHARGDEVQPALGRQRAHLVRGVHRVVAADVEEIADVVRLEHLDRAVEVLPVLLLELVAAGADRAGRRRDAQQLDLLRRLRAEVHQLLLQHALDAVEPGVDRAEIVRERPARINDRAKAVVDDGRRPAGLRDDDVLAASHDSSLKSELRMMNEEAAHRSSLITHTSSFPQSAAGYRIQPHRTFFVNAAFRAPAAAFLENTRPF